MTDDTWVVWLWGPHHKMLILSSDGQAAGVSLVATKCSSQKELQPDVTGASSIRALWYRLQPTRFSDTYSYEYVRIEAISMVRTSIPGVLRARSVRFGNGRNQTNTTLREGIEGAQPGVLSQIRSSLIDHWPVYRCCWLLLPCLSCLAKSLKTGPLKMYEHVLLF